MLNIDKLIQNIDDFVRIIHNIPTEKSVNIHHSHNNIVNQKLNITDNEISNFDHNLTQKEKQHSAGLMRINHVGEICAQALYKGQQFGVKNHNVKHFLQTAEHEELEHLDLCYARLQHLNSHTSYLNPLWYAGAFVLGAVASKVSDATSLAFVVETEKQVEAHLNSHLLKLPQNDIVSRKIVEKMAEDEAEHAHQAEHIGANVLPAPVAYMMKGMAKVMTTVAYYI